MILLKAIPWYYYYNELKSIKIFIEYNNYKSEFILPLQLKELWIARFNIWYEYTYTEFYKILSQKNTGGFKKVKNWFDNCTYVQLELFLRGGF